MGKTSKFILGIVIILLLAVIGIGGYFLVKNNNEANKKIGELENKIDNMEKNIVIPDRSSQNENISTENTSSTYNNKINNNELNDNRISNSVNTEKSEDNNSTIGIKKIELDDVTIVKILMSIEDFQNGQALTNEKYLAIAYNALNEGYIVIDKDRSPSAGKSEVEYKADEINSIIYSLFGVKLTKFEDYGTVLKYNNGVYKFVFSDKGTTNYEAKRITDDVAAGTRYINYDYYVSDEHETEDRGSYSIAISDVTGFVTKKMKIND